MTAVSVPGGDSSDVPEDGYGGPRRERAQRAPGEPVGQGRPYVLPPDDGTPGQVPAGGRAPQPPGTRLSAEREARCGHGPGEAPRAAEPGARVQPATGRGVLPGPAWRVPGGPGPDPCPERVVAADWPAAGDGAGTAPAQVFRPEAGGAPAPDEAETDTSTAPGAGAAAGASAVPVAPPGTAEARERPRPVGHCWDDGLIARRAPRTPAGGGAAPEPTSRSTDRVHPVRRPWPEHDRPEAFPQADPAHGTRPDAPGAPQGQPAGGRGTAGPGSGECVPGARSRPGTGGLPSPHGVGAGPVGGTLRRRLVALRELIGLSRTRLEGRVLAEAGRVLDEAGARAQLSADYTTVAIAGATGSGKSSLLNALAGRTLSETGLSRPTTAQPVACTWEAEREGGADGLLDRLGIAPTMRRRVKDAGLHGLVLIDLPDHDSVAPGHREHVDRLLELVDAVVWVVDPEKYADAVLHERYLRPLAGYAEVTFVVLNQVDRLPGDAADAVLHDLRRLLDEDGMALGDYGEPGARVLATSALTGEGMPELREELGAFAAAREAPARRLTADLDGAAERLRPVYADPALPVPAGLTDADREEFEDLLAAAVGARAAGQAAERVWLRHAERSCGTPWSQLVRWRDARARPRRGPLPGEGAAPGGGAQPGSVTAPEARPGHRGVRVARPVLAQAVRQVADSAAVGLPDAWRKTVRDAAWRGAEGLPEALDALVARAASDGRGEGRGGGGSAGGRQGGDHVPPPVPRPPWWTAAMLAQGLLLSLQVVGVFLLVGAAFGTYRGALWLPVLLVVGGAVGAPALAAGCRAAARGPARAYGQEEERRLRRLSAGCGRTRVLEPVAAELLRYREVREQYVVASGDGDPR